MAETKETKSTEKRNNTFDQSKIIVKNGEYGWMKNKNTFAPLTSFILRVDGVVEENGEVTGFMLSAKPKNNRDETSESGWLVCRVLVPLCVYENGVEVNTQVPLLYILSGWIACF